MPVEISTAGNSPIDFIINRQFCLSVVSMLILSETVVSSNVTIKGILHSGLNQHGWVTDDYVYNGSRFSGFGMVVEAIFVKALLLSAGGVLVVMQMRIKEV